MDNNLLTMSKKYRTRKKKLILQPKEEKLKNVRINNKTIIQVPVDIPDEVARDRFLKRYNLGPKIPPEYIIPKKDLVKEKSIGSLEEMESILDDSNLPESDN